MKQDEKSFLLFMTMVYGSIDQKSVVPACPIIKTLKIAEYSFEVTHVWVLASYIFSIDVFALDGN